MGKDKIYYFVGSALMTFVLSLGMSLLLAAFFTFLLGVAKELIHDLWYEKGDPDWYDMLANVGGIVLAVLFVRAFL